MCERSATFSVQTLTHTEHARTLVHPEPIGDVRAVAVVDAVVDVTVTAEVSVISGHLVGKTQTKQLFLCTNKSESFTEHSCQVPHGVSPSTRPTYEGQNQGLY